MPMFFKNRFGTLNRVRKQLVAIVCLTLVGCYYVQQNFFHSNTLATNKLNNNRWPIASRVLMNVKEINCLPKSNIVFLKAHKCASSTIQNIFMRYGYKNNRVFVLPPKGNYLGHPKLFEMSFVPASKDFNSTYNILTHHSRLNYPEMSKLMPMDTVFLTILRDPVELFESMFQYYSMHRFWDVDFELFNDPNGEIPDNVKHTRYAKKFGPNQMMFDFGFEVTSETQLREIVGYIRFLDSIFSLVMISEKMDESLILLKHLLCWTDDDLIVFKVNARNQTTRNKISGFGKKRIKNLNFADQILYDYFLNKFNKEVAKFGEERMKAEIKALKLKTEYYYDYCVEETFTNKGYPVVHFVNQKENNLTCQFLTQSELKLTAFIRDKQIKRFPGSVYTAD